MPQAIWLIVLGKSITFLAILWLVITLGVVTITKFHLLKYNIVQELLNLKRRQQHEVTAYARALEAE